MDSSRWAWRATWALAVTAVVLYVADQLTKAWVVATIPYGEQVPVIGNLVVLWHLRNTGAAFSLFQGATWLFVPVHLLAIGMVAYFHIQLRQRSLWIHVVLGAILAGGLGNLTDRLRQGYVTDFVSVGIGDLRWPAFNVADPCLVLGIIILVAYLMFAERSEPARDAGDPSS
ncbi:MAG: signal peptidase II [Chloroflexi bacterium]|nr:signal peptidase II [Chloroflexota bacterium]